MENNGRSVVVLHPDGTHEILNVPGNKYFIVTYPFIEEQIGSGDLQLIGAFDVCTGFIKVLGRETAENLVMACLDFLIHEEDTTEPWNLLASYTMGYQHPIRGNAVYMMLGTDEDGEPAVLRPLTEEQSTAISIVLSACGSRRVEKK